MKRCFKCGETKSISEFYKHPQMADGHLNKCKECNKADVRKNRADKIHYYREYDRLRAHNPERRDMNRQFRLSGRGMQVAKKARAAYASRHPSRTKATRAFSNAVRDRRVTPLPCEVCGHEITEGHHSHYGLPLMVTWLCKKHHLRLHREFNAYKRYIKAVNDGLQPSASDAFTHSRLTRFSVDKKSIVKSTRAAP